MNFYLFYGDASAPATGIDDYRGRYTDPRAAKAAISTGADWAQLVCVLDDDLRVVAGWDAGGGYHTSVGDDVAPGLQAAWEGP